MPEIDKHLSNAYTRVTGKWYDTGTIPHSRFFFSDFFRQSHFSAAAIPMTKNISLSLSLSQGLVLNAFAALLSRNFSLIDRPSLGIEETSATPSPEIRGTVACVESLLPASRAGGRKARRK